MPIIHKSYVYPGAGEMNRESHWYSQATRTGDYIQLAGQGGWEPSTNKFRKTIPEQIDQAFANIELALKTAGGKGLSQVYRVNSYHLSLDDENQDAMVRNFKKYMSEHNFTWTCIEITRLGGGPEMKVEIEVSAYDPEGAKKEAEKSE